MNGIYRISFPNGDFYIGRSFNINKRITKHRVNLKTGRHINYRIQEEYDKQGDFTWDVLEIVEGDKINHGEREMYWIEQLNPTLNLTRGGSSGWEQMVEKRKINTSKEVARKRGIAISEARKKLYQDPEKKKWLIEHSGIYLNNGYKNQKTGGDSPIAKKIMNTDTGEIFGSAKDAAKSVNVHYGSFIARVKKNSETLPFKYI
jgi:group I intron endonuclease